jgi:hypothetical protein
MEIKSKNFWRWCITIIIVFLYINQRSVFKLEHNISKMGTRSIDLVQLSSFLSEDGGRIQSPKCCFE